MIRVHRGPEPSALRTLRGKRLAMVTPTLTGYNGRPVKEALFVAQAKKCAWCERRRDYSSSPVEHYRPKDGAWRNLPGQPRRCSPGHYWWLTWSWENLLFACARCNDQGHKGNYFPLAGSFEAPAPLKRPTAVDLSALARERPLLLDPASDTFLDHVQWVPVNPAQPRTLWNWTPRGLTKRGRVTISILRLRELADEVEDHLLDHVLPLVEELEQHMAGRRRTQGAKTWQRIANLLARDKSLTVATWCAITRWVPAAQVRTWRLPPLPMPQ